MRQVQQLRYTPLQDDRPLRVAAYCRVSSDSADQLNSYASQIQFYTEYIGQHPDWELADIYADEGITGTITEKRDELKRLIADSRKGKIDRVLVKSVSRFARNLYDSLSLARLLKSYGTSVYFEEQKIDTAEMNDELVLTMQSMAAQAESMTISQNMRWSYQKRMEKGEFVGTVPAYGYKLINKTLEVYEPEAIIVRKIFDMYLSGKGKQAIANQLNQEGIPRRHGRNKWYEYTINYILNNERYIGDALLQKKYTTEFPFRKLRNNGKVPQYYIENSHPAIISRKTFEIAQQLQSNKQQRKGKEKTRYPLSTKIRCFDCGRSFRRMITNNIAYWQCCDHANRRSKCESRRYPEEAIYKAFTLLINKLITHREYILTPMIRHLGRMQSRSSNIQAKIYEIDQQLAELNEQNHIIATHRAQGLIDAAEYAAESGAVNNKVTALRAERRKLLSEDENDEMIDNLKTLNSILANQSGIYTEFDESLFMEIVIDILAVTDTDLRFKLIGGLELTETIIRTGRRRRS